MVDYLWHTGNQSFAFASSKWFPRQTEVHYSNYSFLYTFIIFLHGQKIHIKKYYLHTPKLIQIYFNSPLFNSKIFTSFGKAHPARKYRTEIHSESIRTIPIHSDICIRTNPKESEPNRNQVFNTD